MRQSRRAPPIINAPPFVTALALGIIALHGLRILAGSSLDLFFVDLGGVFPDRFWGWIAGQQVPGGYAPYNNALEALIPLAGTALVHGSWSHVLMNTIMLIAVGKPVYSVFARLWRSQLSVNLAFLGLFVAAVVGGSLAHLATHYPSGPPAIGASGGVSGLIAAALMIQNGLPAQLLERRFLSASAVFLVGNIVLAFLGPSLFGSAIAWQAHIGGYVAGAVLFRFMVRHAGRARFRT
ncbi:MULTISPECIES: rhomboid family intramembrane serine protease [Hyphomonas]|uniref:rhomboid family intramembrane serine protease n=1 Tax=Hyphomonas TaxID=85 RepID=UPI003512318B